MSKKALPKKPLTKRRLKNLVLNVVKNPFNMIVLISLIILFCLIIIPLLTMIATTFTAGQAELRRIGDGAKIGDFTLYYWRYMLASNMSKAVLWEPLMNSLIIGVFVVIISVPLGSVLAWLMVRTDISGKEDPQHAGHHPLHDPLLDQSPQLAGGVPQFHQWLPMDSWQVWGCPFRTGWPTEWAVGDYDGQYIPP